MFPQEYINRGQLTFTPTSVSLYSDMHHCKNLNNVPCGRVVNAYWQGSNVHVVLDSGWHYVYNDFSGYSSRWKE